MFNRLKARHRNELSSLRKFFRAGTCKPFLIYNENINEFI